MDAEDPYTVDIDVRFRDLDPMGHVNNAVYATYLEHARAGYFRTVIGEPLAAVDTVLAHLSIDYNAPIEGDETVTVALAVPEVGRSSITMAYEVRADAGVAATAETVQVAWDRESGASRAVPAAWRRAIEAHEGRGG